jgi:hypothetical protein
LKTSIPPKSTDTFLVARVKELSLQETPQLSDDPWDEVESSTSKSLELPADTSNDPTIANATMNELDDPTISQMTNSTAKMDIGTASAPAAAGIGADASNAAADAGWDPSKAGSLEDPMAESYEIIPRDLAETETAPSTTGATAHRSWADDSGDASWTGADTSASASGLTEVNGTAAPVNEGFQEVVHHRGGRGRGGFRGEAGHRGGGQRGGRGRGGNRGGERGERGGERGSRPRGGGYRGRGRGD